MNAPENGRASFRGARSEEYLGADDGGREYYLLGGQVYSHAEPDGPIVWVGSLATLNRAERMRRAAAA